MKKNIITLFIIILSCHVSQAQDPVFTQYYFMPETLNPGFSGFEEASYTGILHRTQWPSLDLKINTQYGFFNTWFENMNSGIGVSVLNQHESNTNYNFTQLNANYAYRVRLNSNWYFRPAIELGVGLKSFAFKNLVLADQININTGVVSATSIDPSLANDKIYFFDVSAGLVFDRVNNGFNEIDYWFGFSVKHLNRPNISFQTNGNAPLEILYTATANYKFPFVLESNMLLSANYLQQGEYNRLDIGALVQLNHFLLGLTAVTNPAKNSSNSHLLTSINAFTGLEYKHLRFGLSYDFNVSQIGRTGGVYELSLTYLFKCWNCRVVNERRK